MFSESCQYFTSARASGYYFSYLRCSRWSSLALCDCGSGGDHEHRINCVLCVVNLFRSVHLLPILAWWFVSLSCFLLLLCVWVPACVSLKCAVVLVVTDLNIYLFIYCSFDFFLNKGRAYCFRHYSNVPLFLSVWYCRRILHVGLPNVGSLVLYHLWTISY